MLTLIQRLHVELKSWRTWRRLQAAEVRQSSEVVKLMVHKPDRLQSTAGTLEVLQLVFSDHPKSEIQEENVCDETLLKAVKPR
ncbi:uncharacterized protein V6R79_009339 [Siganus canaliculatus]